MGGVAVVFHVGSECVCAHRRGAGGRGRPCLSGRCGHFLQRLVTPPRRGRSGGKPGRQRRPVARAALKPGGGSGAPGPRRRGVQGKGPRLSGRSHSRERGLGRAGRGARGGGGGGGQLPGPHRARAGGAMATVSRLRARTPRAVRSGPAQQPLPRGRRSRRGREGGSRRGKARGRRLRGAGGGRRAGRGGGGGGSRVARSSRRGGPGGGRTQPDLGGTGFTGARAQRPGGDVAGALSAPGKCG